MEERSKPYYLSVLNKGMGKLIVHWSPLHGQARTTASMGAVALAMNHITGERVCLTNTQYGLSDLEGMFDNRMTADKKQVIYQAAGLNALITNIKRDRLTKEDVKASVMPTLIKNVDLLPGVELRTRMSVDNETDMIIYKILTDTVKNCYDWTFVDLAAGYVPQSKDLIDAADIVVVTLSQNKAMWEMFFEKYKHIAEKDNVFFLIGGHNQKSTYNYKNFAKLYQDYNVNQKKVGVVPECIGYMDAISEGSVSNFFVMNRKVTKKDENFEFIQECVNTATKLKAFAYLRGLNTVKSTGDREDK